MTRNHPFEGPEMFDDVIPDSRTDEEVLAELELYPAVARAVIALRKRNRELREAAGVL